jgi:histidinol-phosphate/aromatic aminotransferase/cobyric acid decarboxylase-like protein
MQSFNPNLDRLMPDVYSYPFPEVRKLLGTLSVDQAFMINTLPVKDAQAAIESYNFTPPLELPARADGALDLDELHIPVIERIRNKVSEVLVGIEGFNHAYPNHGSSLSMFTLMAEWKAKGEMEHLAVLDGEYEGYSAYADALAIPVIKHTELPTTAPVAGEVWFISNPNAIDGDWITPKAWQAFIDAGHSVVYDAAYVGLTEKRSIDVTAPNIKAVLTSPSKIFGVFRHRYTGVTYTREPVKALYGTKWFKDVPGLLDTLKLYETFDNSELADEYRDIQHEICQALSQKLGRAVIPSDTLLLAKSALDPEDPSLAAFRRGSNYRFGLTKLFEQYECDFARADASIDS